MLQNREFRCPPTVVFELFVLSTQTRKRATIAAYRMPKDKIDEEVLQLIEDMGCLCGIPGCKGHEDKGGYIEFDASKFPKPEEQDQE